MVLTKFIAKAASEFDALLKASLESSATSKTRVFALFTGDSGADGVSWCPDCNDCKPLVSATFAEAGGAGDVHLIEVPLARAEYKGNPDHWARKHPGVGLKAIPTLILWGKTKKVAELVEGECADSTRVKEMVLEDQ
jgi:hypothetical protein